MQAKRHFRPELLNLLDEIVLFDPLSRDQLREVARLQIKDLAVPLAERGVALAVTDAALNLIVSMNYDPVRPCFCNSDLEISEYCFLSTCLDLDR